MTSDRILAATKPEDLYPGDVDDAKAIYRELSKKWHPDMPSGDAAVFDKLSRLYRDAVDKIATGRWEGASVLVLEGLHSTFTVRTLATKPMRHGLQLLQRRGVGFVFDSPDWAKKHLAWSSRVFEYKTPGMRKEIERYLPHAATHAPLKDGRYLVQVEKSADLWRLKDVQTALGEIDPVHVAWIISSALNLACYI